MRTTRLKREMCLSTHAGKQLAAWPSANQRASGHTLLKSSVGPMLTWRAQPDRASRGAGLREKFLSSRYEHDAILSRRRFASAEQKHRKMSVVQAQHSAW